MYLGSSVLSDIYIYIGSSIVLPDIYIGSSSVLPDIYIWSSSVLPDIYIYREL